jgi:hypothetical protein
LLLFIAPDLAPVSDFIVSDDFVSADDPAPVALLPDDVAPGDCVVLDEPLVSEPVAELPELPCANAGPAMSSAAAAAAVVVFHVVM